MNLSINVEQANYILNVLSKFSHHKVDTAIQLIKSLPVIEQPKVSNSEETDVKVADVGV